MPHVSYSDLRNNLASYMDEVVTSRTHLHVTRQNSSAVVMVSENEYEQIMETVHLLRSPANALRLMRSIHEVNNGALSEHELVEAGNTPA